MPFVPAEKRKRDNDVSGQPPKKRQDRTRRYTKYDKLEYVEDSFHIMHQKLPDYMDEYNHLLANMAAEDVVSLLNGKGGVICFGARPPRGTIYGIPLNRKTEDLFKNEIDFAIKCIHPNVEPRSYVISFIPVHDHREHHLQLVEIRVSHGSEHALYEDRFGQVYQRRGVKNYGPFTPQEIKTVTVQQCKAKMKASALAASALYGSVRKESSNNQVEEVRQRDKNKIHSILDKNGKSCEDKNQKDKNRRRRSCCSKAEQLPDNSVVCLGDKKPDIIVITDDEAPLPAEPPVSAEKPKAMPSKRRSTTPSKRLPYQTRSVTKSAEKRPAAKRARLSQSPMKPSPLLTSTAAAGSSLAKHPLANSSSSIPTAALTPAVFLTSEPKPVVAVKPMTTEKASKHPPKPLINISSSQKNDTLTSKTNQSKTPSKTKTPSSKAKTPSSKVKIPANKTKAKTPSSKATSKTNADTSSHKTTASNVSSVLQPLMSVNSKTTVNSAPMTASLPARKTIVVEYKTGVVNVKKPKPRVPAANLQSVLTKRKTVSKMPLQPPPPPPSSLQPPIYPPQQHKFPSVQPPKQPHYPPNHLYCPPNYQYHHPYSSYHHYPGHVQHYNGYHGNWNHHGQARFNF